MIRSTLFVIFCAFCVCPGSGAAEGTTLEIPGFAIPIDGRGHLAGLIDTKTGQDYLARAQPAPLLQIETGGRLHRPSAMRRLESKNRFALDFASCNVTVSIEAVTLRTHISFELTAVDPAGAADLVVWGPYPTTIGRIVGETIGVVRNGRFAIGIQALNVKTLGGYPESDDDVMPMYNIFDGTDYADIDESKRGKKLFRGNTARPTDFGSLLSAFTRDRSEDRIIENWGHEKYGVPAYDDGGVIGSRIALFGCAAPGTLDRIGAIELAEGLPHPVIDGVWGKKSSAATASYLIVGFGEDTIDEALALTKRAGLGYLYHGGPFETWGHFELRRKQFPSGWAGLRRCAQKAEDAGIRLGLHTLSNFITTNDPYVTPVPDKGLAKVGTSVLTHDIDAAAAEIGIEDPTWFNQMKNNSLRTVTVGDELIVYASVSAEEPIRLLDCKRGAFGTRAAAHAAGDRVGKLIDHGYKVFLADASLQVEMAATLARLFNECGLRQISFDGLEGCWSSGMGQYARTLFVKKWYDDLSDDLQGKVITDASNPGHFFWHIYTRMNWGEPWYAGFRESQTEYRLMNQDYYSRNLMPAMLGWFNMTAATSLEDAEWLLARAAGFDAGFSLCTSPAVVSQNGMGGPILSAVREWEKARLGGAFTDAQKERLKDVEREFHLETAGPAGWNLHPVHSVKKTLEAGTEPGERLSTEIVVQNPGGEQDLRFILQAAGDVVVSGLELEIDGREAVPFRATLDSGTILEYRGGRNARLRDRSWNELSSMKVAGGALRFPEGSCTVRLSGCLSGEPKGALKIELRLMGPAERVTATP